MEHILASQNKTPSSFYTRWRFTQTIFLDAANISRVRDQALTSGQEKNNTDDIFPAMAILR
jgi:hypothetical protein